MIIQSYKSQYKDAICAIAAAVSSKPDKTPQEKEDMYNTYIAYFLDHEPDHCFVALENGVVVGYIVGTCDPDRYLSLIGTYRDRVQDVSRLDHEIESVQTMAPVYPAHLHINILPAGQSKGTGTLLYKAFDTSIGHQPTFLGVRKDRPAAIRFYEKLGFRRLKEEAGGYVYVKDGIL